MSEQQPIKFMAYRKLATLISAALILISLVSLSFQGLNFGLDFTGGINVQANTAQVVNTNDLQAQLSEQGFKGVKVQTLDNPNSLLIRFQESDYESDIAEQVISIISTSFSEATLESSTEISSSFGSEMKATGVIALIAALALVMLYVAIRFQFKFSVGAVGALIHDVIITLGFFSVFQLNFDQSVLAAVLAVIGYSLNDTIVVSDRIRENFREINREEVEYLINVSLSQTLGRTIITSATTALVLLALILFGGASLQGFAVALLVGVLIGTYSSIYVAANILLLTNIKRQDLLVTVKPAEDEEDIPDWLSRTESESEK